MVLRLLGHDDHYVAAQDVYNLLLLSHHVRRADWAQRVLPFLGWRILHSNGPVSAMSYTTCVISEAGQLVRFGHTRSAFRFGEEVALPADLGPVLAVAAAGHHTCAVKASGELVCFGHNDFGQCDVPVDLGPVVAVAAGRWHTCAVQESGELACFGGNDDGECDVPPDLGPVVTVAAGYKYTCAVKASGELVCFGRNAQGQCNVPPDLGPVVAVAAGDEHTCAVKASGELVCFGYNEDGQCDVPPDLGLVVAVAAGSAHTCALEASGELVCFGDNDSGQCDVPLDLGPVVAVAAGDEHTCAVKASGELVCFGAMQFFSAMCLQDSRFSLPHAHGPSAHPNPMRRGRDCSPDITTSLQLESRKRRGQPNRSRAGSFLGRARDLTAALWFKDLQPAAVKSTEDLHRGSWTFREIRVLRGTILAMWNRCMCFLKCASLLRREDAERWIDEQ